MKSIIVIAIFLLGTSAVSAKLPDTITAEQATLALEANAKRSKLFIDLYQVGVFLPAGADASGQAKAFAVDILYNGSLPDKIPEAWKEELLPILSKAEQDKLREAYAGLSADDQIKIVYTPESGSRLIINGKTILQESGPDLISAFQDIWLGRNPVSESLKQELLKSLPSNRSF